MTLENDTLEFGNVPTHQHDVIVIGAGGAGLSAAISAAEQGASVGVVCKSLLGKAHTVMAEGGMAASLGSVEPSDDWKAHFLDTMKGGWGLSDPRMAELLTQEAPDRVRELERWGAVFDRTEDGGISQREFGGHRNPRLAHVGDRTGLEMIRTLQDKTVAEGIDVYMECTITELLQDDERVTGAFGFWRADGEPVVFRAKAVILATGGAGKLYRISSNSWEYTGDGRAMALRAGADLIDMAFVQFHPTGMVWPTSVQGTLVTEGVRGDGGVLLNSDGERFMFDYVPEAYKGSIAETVEETKSWLAGEEGARPPPELLTRDVVARAILSEVEAGRGSEHGGVYLDIANQRSSEYILQNLPAMYHQFKELAEIDITAEPMEVAPTCHYMMGGVAVDAESQETTLPGLYACGEVAGGLHGANRLGGNSLSDLLVFGNRAGIHAGQTAVSADEIPPIDENEVDDCLETLKAPFDVGDDGELPFKFHEELQEVMERYVGIMRNEEGLSTGIEKLEELKARTANLSASARPVIITDGSSDSVEGAQPNSRWAYNPGWEKCFALKNMVDVGLAIAHAAKERRESRGAHSRIDYPEPDDELGSVKFVVALDDGEIVLDRRSVPEPRDSLQEMLTADQTGKTEENEQ